jgi:hypothetical protein
MITGQGSMIRRLEGGQRQIHYQKLTEDGVLITMLLITQCDLLTLMGMIGGMS